MADTKVSAETLVSALAANHRFYVVCDTGAAPDSNAARASQVKTYVGIGTATNDDAAAGAIGETQVATGSAVALTTTTPANVCSISLTAGDWDVSAVAGFTGAGATVTSNITLSHSTTSATQDGTVGKQNTFRFNGGSGFTDVNHGVSLSPYRYSLAATTTVYLVATAVFSTSTYAVSGRLYARRMR